MKRERTILTCLGTLIFCMLLAVPVSAADYTVVKGDCLWKIARTELGSGTRWPEIYDANRSQIRIPDLIYPGQVFTIPGDEAKAEPEPEAAAETTAPAETLTVAEPGLTSLYSRPLTGEASDYSDTDNWASLPEEAEKPADTFYIYPTVYASTEADAPDIVPIDDEVMRAAALDNIELTCGIFSEATNVYAPFYRQSNLSVLAELEPDDLLEYQMQEQRTDIYAALDYYFENLNNGRPFILAGHGQGSVMGKIVLREYMQAHPEYYERMIAAYVPGYSITNEDMEINPNLKFAEGAEDTGVILSWNTEGYYNDDSICVLPGAIAINPLNWKLDETYASASDNPGSMIVNSSSDLVYNLVPAFVDAQLNLSRGAVLCFNANLVTTRVDNPDIPNPFGLLSYHDGDYLLFYTSIQENVGVRTAAWLQAHD